MRIFSKWITVFIVICTLISLAIILVRYADKRHETNELIKYSGMARGAFRDWENIDESTRGSFYLYLRSKVVTPGNDYQKAFSQAEMGSIEVNGVRFDSAIVVQMTGSKNKLSIGIATNGVLFFKKGSVPWIFINEPHKPTNARRVPAK